MSETMKAFCIGEKAPGKPGAVYHPAGVKQIDKPVPKDGECLVKLLAGAMNHRDLFQRQSLYPGIQFSSIMGADGVGQVVSPSSHPLHGKIVLLCPNVGWSTSPDGPEETTGILGAQTPTGGRGTFAEFICMPSDRVVECPAHLTNSGSEGIAQAAAMPLAILTAYRATIVKGELKKGQNCLITGIGGGVAIQALQLAVAIGANVWVTSGSQDKIETAKKMGAKGGVIYKDEKWPTQLAEMLPKGSKIDVVVDSGGGPIALQVAKIVKDGGNIVCFGSTTGKNMEISMANVLKNQNLKGSTMGSFKEFKEAIVFADKHKIKPVVHQVYKGLESAEQAFETMKNGSQFGKLVIEINHEQRGKL